MISKSVPAHQGAPPVTGTGHFQWDAGGWLGSQIGGTAWLLAGASVLAPHSTPTAVFWCLCFAMPNVVGTYLWLRRSHVAPYLAVQILLMVTGFAGLFAWTLITTFKPDLLTVMGTSAITGYLALLVIPAMVIWFHHVEKRASRCSSGQPSHEHVSQG